MTERTRHRIARAALATIKAAIEALSSERSRHRIALAALVILPVVLLWPSLFGGHSYVPWDIAQFPPASTTMRSDELEAVKENNNTDITEIPVMFEPELRFIRDELARGRLPQWNPYARSGVPIWASQILGVWYPPNWALLAAGEPEDTFVFGALLAFLVAGGLMYGFLRHLGIATIAAWYGALAFSLSGTLTVNAHFYQRINALIWLPGMLWSIDLIARRRGRGRVLPTLALAGCMLMTHTAGFPPYALTTSMLAAAFALWVLVREYRGGANGKEDAGGKVDAAAEPRQLGEAPDRAPILPLAGWIGAAALLGVLMASVQTLPSFGFFPESNRTMDPAPNSLAAGGFDPAGWLGYLAPTLFTHPFLNTVDKLHDLHSPFFWFLYSRESWVDVPPVGDLPAIPAGTTFQPNLNFCEYTVFVGTLTLFLAVVGALRRGAPGRRFAAVAALALLLLASATPLLAPVLGAFPFNLVPPTRFTGPVCLFVAWLAALGLDGLGSVRPWLRWTLGAGGLLGAGLCLWFVTKVGNQSTAGLLQALEAPLLEKYGPRFPTVPPAALAGHIEARMGPLLPAAKDQLITNGHQATAALAAGGMLFLLLPLLLAWRHGLALVRIVFVGWTLVELLRFGMPLNTGHDLKARPLEASPVHAFLLAERDRHAAAGGIAVLRAHDSVRQPDPPLPSQLPPDTLLPLRIRDHQAYTFVDGRSHLPIRALYGPEQLLRETWPKSIPDDERLERPYWDMLGVRFVLSEDVLRHAGKRVGPVIEGPVIEGPDGVALPPKRFFVYERPDPLPRAFVVHDFRDTGKGDEGTIEQMIAASFAPSRYALLDSDTVRALGDAPVRLDVPGNTRMLRFPIPDETNRLTIEVAAGAAGYLVANDTHVGGWRAEIDGVPVPIHRANLFQRMVVLPDRAVKVVFSYTTPGFLAGGLLSLLGVLFAISCGAYLLVSRRRQDTG